MMKREWSYRWQPMKSIPLHSIPSLSTAPTETACTILLWKWLGIPTTKVVGYWLPYLPTEIHMTQNNAKGFLPACRKCTLPNLHPYNHLSKRAGFSLLEVAVPKVNLAIEPLPRNRHEEPKLDPLHLSQWLFPFPSHKETPLENATEPARQALSLHLRRYSCSVKLRKPT